jgi:hypothetical protein
VCAGPFPERPRCVPRREVDEPCGFQAGDGACRYGLVCVGYPNGRCAPGLAEGAPCRAGTSDGDPECDVTHGLQCNGFAPQARCIKPRYVALGETCEFNDHPTDAGLMFDPSACRGDGYGPRMPGTTTCESRGTEGAACDPANPDTCMGELTCLDGTCGFADPSRCTP